MTTKDCRESSTSGNFRATSAMFEVVACRCVGDVQGAADVLCNLDYQSLAQVALQLAGQAASTAVHAHGGDGQGAAAQVQRWAEIARLETEMRS